MRRDRAARPNVIVVQLEDVGFSDLGCYGSEIPTPALDGLAGEGLAYSEFHVADGLATTSAALLTGRDAHAVGLGRRPGPTETGRRGQLTAHAATLPEILGDAGYDTCLLGGWHLTPPAEARPRGPFRHWPTRRGFARSHGPFGAEGATKRNGWHTVAELADRAVGEIRARVHGDERPFYLHLAPGGCRWPNPVPPEAARRFRGVYDAGWDALRRTRLARQVELGVVPPGTRIASDDPAIVPWETLTLRQRRYAARLQEVYAAHLAHVDAQIGRVLAALEETGQAIDTLVMVLSSNAADARRGPVGAFDMARHRPGAAAIGRGDTLFDHFPLGWAQAANTPLRWRTEQGAGAGPRAPLLMRWPSGLGRAKGVAAAVPPCGRRRGDRPRRDGMHDAVGATRLSADPDGRGRDGLFGSRARSAFAAEAAVLRRRGSAGDLGLGLEGGDTVWPGW